MEISQDLASLSYSDILATLCYHVRNLEENKQKALYIQAAPSFQNCVQMAVKLYPFLNTPLIDRKPNPEAMSLLDLTQSKEPEKLAVLLGAISKIDTMLDIGMDQVPPLFLQGRNCRIVDDCFCSERFYQFHALNEKTKDRYGLILPKLPCAWAKKSSRSLETVAMDPLSFALLNYIWVPNSSHWEITNLYSDFWNVSSRIQSEWPQLKIISSPIDYCAPFLAKTDTISHHFYIGYVEINDQHIKKRIKKIMDYAAQNEANIVLFPEMMGTRACIDMCKDYIQNYLMTNIYSARPKLILLPTREHQTGGAWYNTLDILDEDGECIFRYHKQYPFIFDKESVSEYGKIEKESFFEPIQSDGKICVIHVPGIGRIGVMICADIFYDGYLEYAVRDLKLTLILLPVFSCGSDQMERALAITKRYSCDVILCNTCAAWDSILIPPDTRKMNDGFHRDFINVYYPHGHRANHVSNSCEIKCTAGECQGCLFETEVPNKYTATPTTPKQIRLEDV